MMRGDTQIEVLPMYLVERYQLSQDLVVYISCLLRVVACLLSLMCIQ